MLHRGFHTLAPKVGSLFSPTQATSGLALLLEEKEIPNWQGYMRLALIDLMGWLVIFALLLLIANYMQNAFSPFPEQ
jgi:hypothetical protein